eukprot:IDg1198t1
MSSSANTVDRTKHHPWALSKFDYNLSGCTLPQHSKMKRAVSATLCCNPDIVQDYLPVKLEVESGVHSEELKRNCNSAKDSDSGTNVDEADGFSLSSVRTLSARALQYMFATVAFSHPWCSSAAICCCARSN